VALKALLGRYLPRELYDLPKRGFAPPVLDWVRGQFRTHIADLLSDPAPEFDRASMRSLVERYRSGKPVNHALIWYLFSYHAWQARWRAS
jgi:asparagine synthase (glutamine-hydrolysing)